MYILLLLLQLVDGSSSINQLWRQGRSQLEQAQYADAAQTLLAAAHEAERSHETVAIRGSVINDLAMVYRHLGDYRKAESFYNDSINLLRSDPQCRSQLAMALSNKATMYRDMGMNEQSARSFQESFEVAKMLPKDDPALAVILIGMAAERSLKGDLKKAEHYLQQSLHIREAAGGPDQLDISEVLNNLGVVQLQRKRYAEAESSLKRALVIVESHAGTQHPDVAVVLKNLGNVYYQRKEYDVAESVLTRALSIQRKTLPAESFSTADTLMVLARVLMATNRSAEAQPLRQEADAIQARARQMRAELKYVLRV